MNTQIKYNSRFNYVPVPERDKSKDDIFYKWSYEKRIKVLSTNKDGSVDKFVEEYFWKKEQCSWKEFIESYDIGSTSDQVIDHLTKGTPLVTAHTLPDGDYTKLSKGAEIKREMDAKGITIDMIVSALNAQNNKVADEVKAPAESEAK